MVARVAGVARDLPRPHLRGVLLVLITAEPTYGYDLLDQLSMTGVRMLDAGTLYRMLRGLERDGLLESWWEDSSSGPPRRTYALTAAGHNARRLHVQAMRETIEVLSEVVARADSAGRPAT